MIFKSTQIGIADNTGVRSVKVLQVYRYPQARVGDFLLAVLRKKKKLKKYVKQKIHFVFLFSRRTRLFRARGAYFLKLVYNRAVILTPDKEKFLGTRHRAFLTLESRKKAFVQLIKSCRVIV